MNLRFLLLLALFALLCACGDTSLLYTSGDINAPEVRLFLGTDPVADACETSLQSREDVSSRIVPFNLCVRDQKGGGYSSGLSAICLKAGDIAQAPEKSDACWTAPDKLTKLVVLQDGSNTYTVFARDLVGNIGRTSQAIRLNVSIAPQVEIDGPTPAEILSAPWASGDHKVLSYVLSDDDTPVADIKLIVSLLDKTTPKNFVHLGCNFANSPLWKQCPASDLENSSGFIPVSATGAGSFQFDIPAGWPSNRSYVVAITAIDRSGNAAVVSTQEVNAPFEVIAGRSYRGLGSSPTRYQRQGEATSMALDGKGALLLPRDNIRLNPFDRRTCRMTRPLATDIQPFDCADAITTDYSLNLQYNWVHDSVRDVFYALAVRAGQRFLMELDFNTQKASVVLGGTGKTLLAPAANLGIASNYQSQDLGGFLFFEEASGRLFFRTKGYLYAMDRQKGLHFIAGSGAPPVSTQSAALSSIGLPQADLPFAVTADGRVFLSDVAEASWSKGSGFGVQYVLEAPALLAPSELGRLIRVTGSGSPAARTGDNFYFRWLSLDTKGNRLFTSAAWWGHAYLPIPPKGAAGSSYSFTFFTNDLRYSGTDNDFLDEGSITAVLPKSWDVLSHSVLHVSGDVVYISGTSTGSVLSVDLSSGRMERIFGFGNPAAGVQGRAMNAKLDNPVSLCSDGGSRIFFNDSSGLNQVTLDTSSAGKHSFEAKVRGFLRYPFRCDTSNGRLIHMRRNSLDIYDMANVATAPHSMSDPRSYGYDGQYGLGNDLTQLKRLYVSNFFDTVQSIFYKSQLVLSSFGNGTGNTAIAGAALNAPDSYSVGRAGDTYCSGAPCAQAPLQNANYYVLNQYRLPGYYNQVYDRSQSGIMAFDPGDTAAYGCFNNTFGKINVSGKLYPFNVYRSGSSTPLSCVDNTVTMVQSGGNIYFATAGLTGVHKLDVSLIETQNTATATAVGTVGAFPASLIADFYLTTEYIYFTDRNSDRLMRIKRTP